MKKILGILLTFILLFAIGSTPGLAADKASGLKIGDKIKINGVDTTFLGKQANGDYKWKATFTAPEVNCSWVYDAGKKEYTLSGNLFTASVSGGTVTATYQGKKLSWSPDISISGKQNKVSTTDAILLPFDPINANYQNNTLSWYYVGITRYVRVIEGMLIEYYILDSAPTGDISIKLGKVQDVGFTGIRPSMAWDANNKTIALDTGKDSKGEFILTLANLKDAKYPVTIDPDVSFTTSASDGYLNRDETAFPIANPNQTYNTAWVDTTASGANSNAVSLVVGQNCTYIPKPPWSSQLDGTNIYRSFLYFDTSSLGATAVVTSADLKIYVATDVTTQQDFDLTIQTGQVGGQNHYPHDPLVVADYSKAFYSSDGGHLSTVGISTAAYSTIALNATGISWIINNGTTKLALRSSADIAGTAPNFQYIDDVYYGSGYLSIHSYEKGVGYRPILEVTYYTPAAPTVTVSAATSVTDNDAVFNGHIDDDGGYTAGVSIKWGYGTTSQTAVNFGLYDTVDANFAGTFSTDDAISKTITGTLTTGLTYYYRFQAQNTTGTTTSDEMSFTTLSVPSVATVPASAVSKTTARLNGSIPISGGQTCQVRWGYGTTTQTSANFALYDTVTALAGSYTNGSYPYLDIVGLTDTTPYFFRFQATNATGTTTSGELTFTTSSGISEPTNIVCLPNVTTNKIIWVKGSGSTNTLVRMGLATYPTLTTDGTLVYFGTATTVTSSSLTAGTTYYYSFWGESGGVYSVAYSTSVVTTNAGVPAAGGGVSSTTPWRWISAPNYTNLDNLPIVYDAVNNAADSIAIPRATFWLILALVTAAIGGVVGYGAGGNQPSTIMGIIIAGGVMTLWWLVQIVPWYLLGIYIVFGFLLTRTKKEMD
jgi:hypothetical protein